MAHKTKPTKAHNSVEARAEIARVAAEVLEDPDFGKKLSPKARRRLLAVSEKDLAEAVSLSNLE